MLRGSAGIVIVNGPAHVERLAARFPAPTRNRPIAHIRNGVDLEDVERLIGSASEPSLRLLHTGFFYHFHTPHHLITALHLAYYEDPDTFRGLELEFMGDGFPDQLVQEAEAWGLGGLIRRRAAGSYSDALAAMHRADGLIAVLPPLDGDRHRLPTKLYEYLSTDRPILAVVHSDGAAAQLLDGVPDAIVADNTDQIAISAAFVAFVSLARRRREDGYPPANRRRGEPHHYLERAVAMDAFLRHVIAFTPPTAHPWRLLRQWPGDRVSLRNPGTVD